MSTPLAPSLRYDQVRFHRGTRGFAAFVTAINGLVVLGLATAVFPASDLPDPAMAWAILLGLAGAIGHAVAIYGLVRGRAWSGSLVAYLAAAGIGVSVFALLMITRAGEDILGAGGQTTIGFFVWMIGSWLVAARFAHKPFATPRRRTAPAAVEPERIGEPVSARRGLTLSTAA